MRHSHKEIVENWLGITIDFLDKHEETLYQRLLASYDTMVKEETGVFRSRIIFGINQCVHLATSVVLLGSEPERLRKSMKNAKNRFSHADPSAVLTIATLYYLLTVYLDWDLIYEIKHICRNFDSVNWMIGEETMNALGIERLSKNNK